MRRADGAQEYLDRPLPPAERDASLADIDRLNAWFGGYALTLRALDRALGRVAPSRRLIRHARRRGRVVHVVVVDRDADSLRTARLAGSSLVSVVRADASALPFREASVDVVTIALTLHHMEPDAAVTSLREMHAASRTAVIVNDLWRTRPSLALVWIATRALACHPISRHDGPLSVRRAYSADELGTLAEKAGIPAPRIRRYALLGRLLAVVER